MNGAVSNLATFPKSVGLLGRELRHGGYDVVHVHEPNAPVRVLVRHRGRARARWSPRSTPTPPARFANRFAASFIGARRLYSKLSARIAVSEAAQLDRAALLRRPLPDRPERRGPVRGAAGRLAPARGAPDPLRRAAPRSARACPCCCAPSRRCAASGVPARLTVAGPTAEEVEPLLLDPEGIEIAGQVDDADEVEAARRGRPPVRPVARRRELRDGAHRGVRLGHSGRGLRHRRLPRRRAERPRRRARAGRRRGRARRDAARARVRPGAAHRRCPRPRASAPSASRGRTWRARWSRCTRRRSACPSPRAAWRESRSAPARCPTEPGPRVRPAAAAVARAEGPGRARAARWRGPRRRALVVAGAVAGAGLAGARAPAHRHRVDRPRRCVAATPVWVLVAFALMCASMLRARRGLARDSARGPARHPRAPARRRARRR